MRFQEGQFPVHDVAALYRKQRQSVDADYEADTDVELLSPSPGSKLTRLAEVRRKESWLSNSSSVSTLIKSVSVDSTDTTHTDTSAAAMSTDTTANPTDSLTSSKSENSGESDSNIKRENVSPVREEASNDVLNFENSVSKSGESSESRSLSYHTKRTSPAPAPSAIEDISPCTSPTREDSHNPASGATQCSSEMKDTNVKSEAVAVPSVLEQEINENKCGETSKESKISSSTELPSTKKQLSLEAYRKKRQAQVSDSGRPSETERAKTEPDESANSVEASPQSQSSTQSLGTSLFGSQTKAQEWLESARGSNISDARSLPHSTAIESADDSSVTELTQHQTKEKMTPTSSAPTWSEPNASSKPLKVDTPIDRSDDLEKANSDSLSHIGDLDRVKSLVDSVLSRGSSSKGSQMNRELLLKKVEIELNAFFSWSS